MFVSRLPAWGDNPNPGGPYVGVGWGQFNLNIKNLDDAGTAVSTIRHADDNAKKVFVGYRFNPYWALEAAYVKLGQARRPLHRNGFQRPLHG